MEGRLFKAEWQKEVGLLHTAVVDNTLSMRSHQRRATVTAGLVSQLDQWRLKSIWINYLNSDIFVVVTSQVDTYDSCTQRGDNWNCSESLFRLKQPNKYKPTRFTLGEGVDKRWSCE